MLLDDGRLVLGDYRAELQEIGTSSGRWIVAGARGFAWDVDGEAYGIGRYEWGVPPSGDAPGPLGWGRVDQLSTWGWHTCFIREGNVLCAGHNEEGQLGRGSSSMTIEVEPAPAALPVRASIVDVGVTRTFAIDTAGSLWAWGTESFEVDADQGPESSTPEPWNGFSNLCGIDTGSLVSCAWTCDGEVWCWGANEYDMIAVSNASWLGPTRVRDLEPALLVSASDSPICAIKTDGTVWCRGVRGTGSGKIFEGEALQAIFDEGFGR